MMETSRRSVMLGAASVAIAGAAHRASAQSVSDGSSIDRLFQQMIDAKQIAGVVAVAATDQKPLYQGAFGKRSLAQGGPDMTLDSVFWIASMTKAVTSTAA